MTTAPGDVEAAAKARLPRPPGAIRRLMSAHPRAVDGFIVTCYVLGAAFGAFLDGLFGAGSDALAVEPGLAAYLLWPWWPFAILRVIVVALALWFRRQAPLAGLIVVNAALLFDHGIQGFATWVALLFLLYAVPVYRSAAAGWVGYAVSVGMTIVAALFARLDFFRFDGTTGEQDLGGLVAVTLMSAVWYLAIVLLGVNLGNRRRYLRAIIDRAHQLAREQDESARLAVVEERTRIAREMHDIVAHSLTVMIALSEGAARVAKRAPDSAAEAMARSAETGRTALAEMRRVLGAWQNLDQPPADRAPQPGMTDVPRLVQSFRDAGMRIELELPEAGSSDPGRDLASYRAVQEGLTNALRYAGPGTQARVRIEHTAAGTHILIRDSGPAPGREAPDGGLGSGRGIAGLRERSRMFGGDVSAGPAGPPGTGWMLNVTLPAEQPPGAPMEETT